MMEYRSCTSMLVAAKASLDGSIMIARNEDGPSVYSPVLLEIVKHLPAEEAPKTWKGFNKTEFELPPRERLRHTRLPEADESIDGAYASAGFNEAGVAMSATESIYGGNRALAYDPMIPEGVQESVIPDLVLPYIHSAREGVEVLADYIKKYGSAEGNGILFADPNECWYMEIPTGHHWAAIRIPVDQIAVAPNMAMIQALNLKDHENVMCSEGLEDFVRQHHLDTRLAPDGFINFRCCFGTCDESDRIYNTPRAWDAIRRLAPNLCQKNNWHPLSTDIPFTYKAEEKIAVTDVMDIMGAHFEESEYDPLGRLGTPQSRTRFRPISVCKTEESHILQIFPDAPEGMRNILWLCIGAAAFSPYIPFFADVEKAPESYAKADEHPNMNQAFWLMRTYDYFAETLRFEKAHTVFSLKNKLRQQGLARVEEVRQELKEKALTGEALMRYLEEANEKTAGLFISSVNEALTDLMKYAFESSKLSYKMNPDL